jgi:hypothetical protein
VRNRNEPRSEARAKAPWPRMQTKRERRRALDSAELAEVCGTLSTLLVEDEVHGACSQPLQRGICVTHSESRLVITQSNSKGSRPVEAAKVENFSIKGPRINGPNPSLRRGPRNQ